MIGESDIEKALVGILEEHKKNDSLPEQTPRMLRAQIAERLGVESVDDFKEFVKTCISRFLAGPAPAASEPVAEKENKGRSNKATKPTKSKAKRRAVSSSSDEYSSESSSGDESGAPTSPSALRSIAKAVGVPPSFWSELDKNNSEQLTDKLVAFCDSKNVTRKGRIPTMKEAKKFKAQREAAAELEGIASTNILSGKRKRSQDILPLFL